MIALVSVNVYPPDEDGECRVEVELLRSVSDDGMSGSFEKVDAGTVSVTTPRMNEPSDHDV